MRVRSKTLIGRINPEGKIEAFWESLTDFLSLHKGKAVKIRVEIMPIEPSEKTTNYFFGYLIPELQNAFLEQGEHLSKEQTYDKIRSLCPLFKKEERQNGEWRVTLKEFEELDQAESNEVIDWLYQWAAENLYLILDNPR